MNAFLGTRIKIDLTDYAENLPEAKKMIYTAYNTLGSLYRKNHPPWVKYDKMFKRSKVNQRHGLFWPPKNKNPSRNWKPARDTKDGIYYDTNAKMKIRFRSRVIGVAQKQSDKINHLAFGAIHTNSSATRYHKKHEVFDVDPT